MVQLAPGVRRLGGGLVNSYLIEDAGAITVVDTAMPGDWSALLRELRSMGRSLEDVRAVILTHGHSDHIGYAERARRERGLIPRLHPADVALARGEVPNPAKGTDAIRPLPLIRFLWHGLVRGGLARPRLTEVSTFDDGATLDVPGSPRVIALPGHTPGSVAFHVPSKAALFMGDAMATVSVTSGSTGPMVAPFSADPEVAVSSLARLEGVEASWVLPGHGEPWTGGVGEAVRLIRGRPAVLR